MWLLRDNKIIRVDMYIDPCWNESDIWRARNLVGRFKHLGYSDEDANSMAAAQIWKSKWNGTQYNRRVEKTLKNASVCSEPFITSFS